MMLRFRHQRFKNHGFHLPFHLFGLVMTMVFLAFLSDQWCHAGQTGNLAEMSDDLRHDKNFPNLTSLNIRLSTRSIHPPDTLIHTSIVLVGIHAARSMVEPSPQAAILEDDDRRRVAVLSTDSNGQITAHLLHDIPLKPKIPRVSQCAEERQCSLDRRPVTGGLGCVAICLQKAIDPNHYP